MLAAIGFGSLAIGLPFTLRYAEERAPREVWDSLQLQWVIPIVLVVWAIKSTAHDPDAAAERAGVRRA